MQERLGITRHVLSEPLLCAKLRGGLACLRRELLSTRRSDMISTDRAGQSAYPMLVTLIEVGKRACPAAKGEPSVKPVVTRDRRPGRAGYWSTANTGQNISHRERQQPRWLNKQSTRPARRACQSGIRTITSESQSPLSRLSCRSALFDKARGYLPLRIPKGFGRLAKRRSRRAK